MAKRAIVRVGVFLPTGSQLLDCACVDIFHIASNEYLSLLSDMLPASLVDLAPSVQIFYISQTPAGSLVDMTANVKIPVTHHLNDPEVQPGKLDIILVPGPDPKEKFGKGVTGWLAAQAESAGTDVLCVCTGIFLCGEAGLLKGKRASGPRGMQGLIKQTFEGVRLVGEEFRWVQDGNFWSSGGITNGNDLVAAYIRHSKLFPDPVAEIACKMADVGDRGQMYGQGQASFTIGFVWQLLKAWFTSVGKGKAN